MMVRDPKPRNAFIPRSWPATVFGPSQKVPGGMIVFQGGRLKEVVNLQISSLQPEELVFVKAKLQDHDEPFAPTDPPTCTDWDAAQADGPLDEAPGEASRVDFDDQPEAPCWEEQPEVPKIMPTTGRMTHCTT